MNERQKEKLKLLEDEIRAACTQAAAEGTPAKFRAAVTRDLRGAQYVVTENWVQNGVKVELLAWKNGVPIALRIIDADELAMQQLDGLEKIKFERQADIDKTFLRFVIHLGEFRDFETEQEAGNRGFIWIAPKVGSPTPVAALQEQSK